MATRRHILIALYLAVVCAPVAAKLARVHEHRLEGAFAPAPFPAVSLDDARSEKFQLAATAWFESTLGLRSWSIWLDNTVLYQLFGETKWGSHVAIGEGGMLFERDDINYFNRGNSEMPNAAAVERFADTIATLQRRLQREHRALVPIFLPSKTTFYRDKVSSAWTRALGDPRPGQIHIYQAMKAALERRGVRFVDGIDLLMTSSLPRQALWTREARHFSPVAGCLSMSAIMEHFAALTGRPPVAYPCMPREVRVSRAHSDFDLYRLMNAWGVDRGHTTYEVERTPPPKPAKAPSAMWISTSFGWLLEIDAVQSQLFGDVHLDYYNRALFQDGVEGSIEVQPHSPPWRAVFLTRDLYVLELHESYLVPGAFFGEDAANAILEDLGP